MGDVSPPVGQTSLKILSAPRRQLKISRKCNFSVLQVRAMFMILI